MVWFVVKWYALLTGVKLGLQHKRRVNTVGMFDMVLKEHYIGPLREELRKSPRLTIVLDEDCPPGYIYMMPG